MGHHDTRVQAMAWSPKTSLMVAPKVVEFCTSGTDHKVRLFTSDLEEVQVRVLKGHTDYINSLVFEPENGECTTTLNFKSPVMSVQWHQEELGKVLVGQKSGIISLFNSLTLQPILSVDCGIAPLLSTDWCHSNALLLTAAVSTELVIFDLSTPSLPSNRRHVHGEGARYTRCSRHNDSLVATAGRPGNCLKVWHSKSGVMLVSSEMVLVWGMSWHSRIPYLAVGGDREVQMYKVQY